MPPRFFSIRTLRLGPMSDTFPTPPARPRPAPYRGEPKAGALYEKTLAACFGDHARTTPAGRGAAVRDLADSGRPARKGRRGAHHVEPRAGGRGRHGQEGSARSRPSPRRVRDLRGRPPAEDN